MCAYTVVVEPDEPADFVVSVLVLPGCFTHGKSLEECRERATKAIEVHIAGLLANDEPVPEEAETSAPDDDGRRLKQGGGHERDLEITPGAGKEPSVPFDLQSQLHAQLCVTPLPLAHLLQDPIDGRR